MVTSASRWAILGAKEAKTRPSTFVSKPAKVAAGSGDD